MKSPAWRILYLEAQMKRLVVCALPLAIVLAATALGCGKLKLGSINTVDAFRPAYCDDGDNYSPHWFPRADGLCHWEDRVPAPLAVTGGNSSPAAPPDPKAHEADVPEGTRKAWEHRSDLEEKMVLDLGCDLRAGETFFDGGVSCRKWLEGEKLHNSATSDESWHSFVKDIPKFLKPQDVVLVRLSKTVDGGEWVISLIGLNGKRMSYWLDSGADGGGYVRSISPY